MLRLAVEGEIEDLAADFVAAVEVAVGHRHLVAHALRHGHDFARRRNDGALADKVAAPGLKPLDEGALAMLGRAWNGATYSGYENAQAFKHWPGHSLCDVFTFV